MSLNHATQSSQLTDEHFKAIGKLVVEWANIEFTLRSTLTRLLLTPDFLGRTYTDQMSAARVQEAMFKSSAAITRLMNAKPAKR
jgi:hypothetical protein